jgi:hypothetical protein
MIALVGAAHKIVTSFVLLMKRIVLVWRCHEISWMIFGAVNKYITYLVLSSKQLI